ncbi:MAG: ribbon-helix-helix domain-containing protein [Archangium sp.]|nr:ribbon-helix-helix domain-containing protein [Archangium sp.]MBM4776488.1 ribbon-helix-helix domain-containing protein [Archangiaceae bacterium]
MHDAPMAVPVTESTSDRDLITKSEREVVSTHVLVEQEKVEKLRELSKRTRIAQSEYLREAVDDLLSKYDRKPEDD